ncbi:tRNA (adenine57-N1/adenine58-N1)-methyltransferase [Nematocida sp. ERTm5]|nr:tRNA (adenine57-N1/adenine58-N1)-methyltransferase [Nematocida sp. ERTm5]
MHMHIEYLNRNLCRVIQRKETKEKNKEAELYSTEKRDTTRNNHKKGILLEINCDRWIKTSQKRTQIIYRSDASSILYHMALPNNSHVIESGTGTLGLTYALSNYFMNGVIDTVECNNERFTAAQSDIITAGMVNVRVHHSTIEEYINTVVHKKEKVNGIFLDVPEPESVLTGAASILYPEGKISCFIPCIEQVQRVIQRTESISNLCIERVFENVEVSHKPALIQNNTGIIYGTTPCSIIRGHTGYILILRVMQ